MSRNFLWHGRVWDLVEDMGVAGIDGREESGHGGGPRMHGIITS